MRADRLVAVLMVLQARGRVTVAELAEELEISPRTARRDLEALALGGVPVYSRAGKGGGWSLVGGARTDLSGLTAAEAQALFLLAGPSSSATPAVKSALRKLVQALPETFRDEARAAASAVVLDPTQWDRTTFPPPPFLDDLQQAVVRGVQVRLGYTARDRSESVRAVHPLGLVVKTSVWYLVADTEAGLRTFRVDRVRSVELTDQAVTRPEGFDLAATWKAVMARMEEQRATVVVLVAIEEHAVPWLRASIGTRLSIVGARPDGRVEVRVRGANARAIVGELARFGGLVEVIEPPDVRALLAQLGHELVARHG